MIESLRIRDFRRFLLAIFFFTAAMQIQVVAQGWLVFHITGANLALGIVTSLWSITLIVISPLAGVLADRMDRRGLVMFTWGGAGVIFSVLTLLIFTDRIQIWHLAVASMLQGVLFSFNIPARFALISQMVGDARLMNAMALFSLSFSLSGVVFPLISGTIIDLLGAEGAYLATSLLHFMAAAFVSFVPPQGLPAAKTQNSILKDMVGGISFIRGDPRLLGLLALALAAVVLGQPYAVLLPDFAATTLQFPASGLGLLIAMISLGSLVGNLVVASMSTTEKPGRWMLILGGVSGVALVGLALSRSIYPGLAALFFLGLTGSPFFTINQTLVQHLTPPEVRGRVMSLYMLTWGAMPLGIIAVSALADATGLWLPILLCGGAMLVTMILIAWLSPALLHLSAPSESLEVDTGAV